jgi:small-conductance mechanosensitive channel
MLTIWFLFKRYILKFVRNILLKIGFNPSDRTITISEKYVTAWFFYIVLYIAFLQIPNINTINVAIIHKLFYIIFAFSILIFLASAISKLIQKVIPEKTGIANVANFVIIFIGSAFILSYAINIKLASLFAGLGISSSVVGTIIFKDVLADPIAGISIIVSKQIVKGDFIKLDSGQEGTVIEVRLKVTILKEINNSIIIVPNSKLSYTVITSYHSDKEGVTASVSCKVAYGSDLKHVEETAFIVAQEIIDKNNDAIKTFKPLVRFSGFENSSINFNIFFRVKNTYAKFLIQHEILKNLYEKFNDKKIEIEIPTSHKITVLKKNNNV